MIRLFNAYFPTRTLLLTLSEAILVTLGFLVAVLLTAGTAVDAESTCFTRMALRGLDSWSWSSWC